MNKTSFYKLSRFYNQKRGLSQEFWIAFFDEINKLIVPGKKRWLDLGCGSGRIMIPLAINFPDIQFFGIDVSMDMLFQFGRSANLQQDFKNTAIFQADLNYSIPIREGPFDCISLFQTIHYFNMEVIYSEISHLVSEGTLLIIASTTHDQFKELPYCAYTPVLEYEIARTPDFDEIERDALLNGFSIIYCRDFTIYKKLGKLNQIKNYLRSLPYSAFCVLTNRLLEEAIEATLSTVNDSTANIGFKVDSFRLTVFKYMNNKKDN